MDVLQNGIMICRKQTLNIVIPVICLDCFRLHRSLQKRRRICVRPQKKHYKRNLTPIENWEDTGWARSMLMLYEARLQNGENAYAHICYMMEHLLEPNFVVISSADKRSGSIRSRI